MLENIEIIDYKCFKDFKLNGLGQINIISGGNNVGKTALLEVLFLEATLVEAGLTTITEPIPLLSTISKNRDILEDKFVPYLKSVKIKLKSDRKKIDIKYKPTLLLDKDEKDAMKIFNQDYFDFLVSRYNEHIQLIPIDNFRIGTIPNNYINSSKPTNRQLIDLYSTIQTKGIQHDFFNYLKVIDNNISWLEPQMLNDELYLRLTLKHPKITLTSSELGEGTNRYIEILATLLSNSKGSVFIDEIENGIHYSKLKEIFKVIIEIVQKEDIQLFITTHDSESIEAFGEVCEEVGFKSISSIELYKNEENEVKSIIRNYEQFVASVDAGMEVR